MTARKILLTFLGTSSYQPCQYRLPTGQESEQLVFVQEAIVRSMCAEWEEKDRIYVFLTEQAKAKNWSGGQGLQQRLEHASSVPLQDVAIPDALNEREIWDIFSIISEHVQAGDHVVIDITHGFRSLPLLTMTLLNYLKVTKKITVEDILYGAFEAKDAAGVAPILSLRSFDTLLDWGQGAELFLNHGITTSLEKLTVPDRHRMPPENANRLANLGRSIKTMSQSLRTCRGKQIINGRQVTMVKSHVSSFMDIVQTETSYRPLRAILNKIQDRLEQFQEDSVNNVLAATHWSFHHGNLQQTATLLQEGIVSLLLQAVKLNVANPSDRMLATEALHIVQNNLTNSSKWKETSRKRKPASRQLQEKIRDLSTIPTAPRLSGLYDKLRRIRNDLNHAGMLKDAKSAQKVEQELEKILDNFTILYRTQKLAFTPE